MSIDYFNPPNSIWPNALKRDEESYVNFYPLDTNKVDTTTITWPEGNKVISPFVYQDDKLVGFIDTKALSSSDAPLIIPNKYETFKAEASPAAPMISSYENGMPNAVIDVTYKVEDNEQITYITEDNYAEFGNYIQNNMAQYMVNEDVAPTKIIDNKIYIGEQSLSAASFYTPAIIFGYGMFMSFHKLKEFDSDLSSLVNGCSMFNSCDSLTSFKSNLTSLTDINGMFSNCPNLETFDANLSSLSDGNFAFHDCSNLTSFKSDLSSLSHAPEMFSYCKLNAESIKNIASSLKDSESPGSITLGLGIDDTDEARLTFAQELGCSSWSEVMSLIPGWNVTIQFNGSPLSTYSLRNVTPSKIYAKIEEVVDENKRQYARYSSQDGNIFYILYWYHESNTDNNGYMQFNSLEEAIETFNIKPIERN